MNRAVKAARSEPKRVEVKDGNIVVPIYEFTDGRFCVDMKLGEKRKRITRASLDAAKVEARKLIAKIKSGRQNEVLMKTEEVEEYQLAKGLLTMRCEHASASRPVLQTATTFPPTGTGRAAPACR